MKQSAYCSSSCSCDFPSRCLLISRLNRDSNWGRAGPDPDGGSAVLSPEILVPSLPLAADWASSLSPSFPRLPPPGPSLQPSLSSRSTTKVFTAEISPLRGNPPAPPQTCMPPPTSAVVAAAAVTSAVPVTAGALFPAIDDRGQIESRNNKQEHPTNPSTPTQHNS
eukprot:GHVU01068747.1.p1 GENE.GHVU01068747.1~~GHVU01068747.1.p1  ORF type:complete len:166 (-),score=14.95 GHVU01068747.1:129-626(-)